MIRILDSFHVIHDLLLCFHLLIEFRALPHITSQTQPDISIEAIAGVSESLNWQKNKDNSEALPLPGRLYYERQGLILLTASLVSSSSSLPENLELRDVSLYLGGEALLRKSGLNPVDCKSI